MSKRETGTWIGGFVFLLFNDVDVKKFIFRFLVCATTIFEVFPKMIFAILLSNRGGMLFQFLTPLYVKKRFLLLVKLLHLLL